MEYISTKEAAENWGVTLRLVQRYIAKGRISGAKKFGGSYFIPAETEKPSDPRKTRRQAPARPFYTMSRQCPMLLFTTMYNTPGSADDVMAFLAKDGTAQTMFRAWITFARGNLKEAKELMLSLPLEQSRPDVFIAVTYSLTVYALYHGDVQEWLFYEEKLRSLPCLNEWEAAQRDFWLGCARINLYDTSALPGWFCEGDFSLLPKDSYPMARYTYVRYTLMKCNTRDALYIAPVASECMAEGALMGELYCRIGLAIRNLEFGDTNAAAKHLDRAIALALPDRLYTPLADFRAQLGLLLDERLSLVDKEALRIVKALGTQVDLGWAALNRELRGLVNTTSLNQQERQVAKLVAQGLSNAQIAERMHVSVNTVKRYVSGAISKTGARNRTELSKYIAQKPIL